jgi:hypothetical protein
MNTTHNRAALAAATETAMKHAALRAAGAFAAAGVSVDADKALIRNAAVMTAMQTRGHGFTIDATTLKQVAALINEQSGGVKVRFKHQPLPIKPENDNEPVPDDLGTDVGHLVNARVEGDAVRGDIQLADYAEVLPGLGNVKDYILRKAKSDPTGIGLSAEIFFELEEQTDAAGNVIALVARVKEISAVDFVGKPAANPNGLLSAKSSLAAAAQPGEIGMNETLKRILCNMGLSYDASDEAAQAFFNALSDAQKEDIQSKLNAIAAAAKVEADQAAAEASSGAAHAGAMAAQITSAVIANLKQAGVTSTMNPKTKQNLIAIFGLAADATDDVAKAKYDSLSAEDKARADGSTAQLAATQQQQQGGTAGADGATIAAAALQTQKAQLIAEGERVTMLRQLGETLGVDNTIVQLAIAENEDVTKAQTRYLKHLKEKCKPIEGLNALSVGEDKKVAALAIAMPEAICKRAGLSKFYAVDSAGRVLRDDQGNPKTVAAHELAEKYVGLSALDMYRQWLVMLGADRDEVAMLSRTQLAELLGPRALRRKFPQVAQLAQSTGDFANVVLDAQNKSLRMGYVEAPRTWMVWAKRGTAPDFKNINRIQTSEVPTLTSRAEGQPISYTTLADSKETYALAEYANGIILTRRVLINDDMNALTDVPRKQGASAARLEDDVAYAILTANANLADGGALFNATAYTVNGTGHQNRQSTTAGVGAPTVATVSATEKLVMLQKGPKAAAILNLTPKFWVGPVALKTTTEQFFASRVDPSKSNETPNPYNGKITPVANARLDASSAVIWYLLADYRDGQIDTIEVSFLTDEPEPVLKQETDFDTDDQKFAVRHTVAAKALDFRGMARNDGA